MTDDIKLPEPAGWVNVNDRMPGTDNQVLVYVPANKYMKLPEPAGWVNVNDRMPDTDNQVLVYVPANKYMKVQIDSWSKQREAPLSFSSATIETGFGWDNFEFEEVTHWMPIPAAPHDFAMFTADQLRAAVLADRAERASAAENPKTCTRCGGEMKPGQAIENTLVGAPDDMGGCVTVSPGGPGKLVPCMKCAECGWSVTVGSDK